MIVDGYTITINSTKENETKVFGYISYDDAPFSLIYNSCDEVFKDSRSILGKKKIVLFKFVITICNSYCRQPYYRELMHTEEEIQFMGGFVKALDFCMKFVEDEVKLKFPNTGCIVGCKHIYIRREFVKKLMKLGEIECFGRKENN